MGTDSYNDDRHACTVVEAEFRAVSGVCSGLVEGLSQLLRWKDELLASSSDIPAKSLMSLAMISSNLHRSQTQLPSALKGLRKVSERAQGGWSSTRFFVEYRLPAESHPQVSSNF